MICYDSGQRIVGCSECSFQSHYKCLESWLAASGKLECPQCRRRIRWRRNWLRARVRSWWIVLALVFLSASNYFVWTPILVYEFGQCAGILRLPLLDTIYHAWVLVMILLGGGGCAPMSAFDLSIFASISLYSIVVVVSLFKRGIEYPVSEVRMNIF